MVFFANATPTRVALDNRINRDLIAQARSQGFVFSNPTDDFPIWQHLETADLENPVSACCSCISDWLLGKAVEATLFQFYVQHCRPTVNRTNQ